MADHPRPRCAARSPCRLWPDILWRWHLCEMDPDYGTSGGRTRGNWCVDGSCCADPILQELIWVTVRTGADSDLYNWYAGRKPVITSLGNCEPVPLAGKECRIF